MGAHAELLRAARREALANNGDLVANALDNLAGSTDLISVRGRATFTRPFDRVEALRRNAEDSFRATEQQLERELKSHGREAHALQSKRNDKSSMILSPEQEQELERFQQEKTRIRRELRDVRSRAGRGHHAPGHGLKVVNIALVPAAFALIAGGLGSCAGGGAVMGLRRWCPLPRHLPRWARGRKRGA